MDQQTEQLLKQRGFAGAPHTTSEALIRYQQWHGLVVTGTLDAITLRSLTALRICAHPDRSPLMDAARADLMRWDKTNLTYHITKEATFGTLNREQVEAAWAWAWLRWTTNCNLTATLVSDAKDSDIIISTGVIDGPWRNIAYSEFPDGNMQRRMKFDMDEKWAYGMRPVSRWSIDLAQCAMHEIGHVLGIPHLTGECVMSPIYDRRIDALHAADIHEALLRYPR